jgi:hypothetical protein
MFTNRYYDIVMTVTNAGLYLRKITPMASTKIAFYIYYLLIISPGIHVYVYYMVFAKLLQENYLRNTLTKHIMLILIFLINNMNRKSKMYVCYDMFLIEVSKQFEMY